MGTDAPANPCIACGACCAAYRVSFYWAEAEERGLEPSMVEQVDAWMGCMAGTNHPSPRCAALAGPVGGAVRCVVYERRPGACRDLLPGSDQCDRARARHGLPPLEPVTN